LSAAEPFRRVANLRRFFGDRVFRGTARRHITSRLCRKENLRNLFCLQFAARLVGAVNARSGWLWRTRLKLFTWFRILRCPLRRSGSRVVGYAAQVPLSTQDFARNLRCLPSMRRKRFKS
jgi:hypothetical protein